MPVCDVPPNLERPELRLELGPAHEGRELELMLMGVKPLAMFYDVYPASFSLPLGQFRPYIARGQFVHRFRRLPYARPRDWVLGTRYHFIAWAGEEWRIARMYRLLDEQREPGYHWRPEEEYVIGRLLGYTDRQIAHFIQGWYRYIAQNPHPELVDGAPVARARPGR